MATKTTLDPKEKLVALVNVNTEYGVVNFPFRLVNASMDYVQGRISGKYPKSVVKVLWDDYSDIVCVSDKVEVPVNIRSFWRPWKVLRKEMRSIDRHLVSAYMYRSGTVLKIHVNDPDIIKACKEVEELTGGEIKSVLELNDA